MTRAPDEPLGNPQARYIGGSLDGTIGPLPLGARVLIPSARLYGFIKETYRRDGSEIVNGERRYLFRFESVEDITHQMRNAERANRRTTFRQLGISPPAPLLGEEEEID